MGKYIHKFNSWEDFEEIYYGSGYTEPWVSCVEGEEDSVIYNDKIPEIPIIPPVVNK